MSLDRSFARARSQHASPQAFEPLVTDGPVRGPERRAREMRRVIKHSPAAQEADDVDEHEGTGRGTWFRFPQGIETRVSCVTVAVQWEIRASPPIGRGTKGTKMRETLDSGNDSAVNVKHE